MLLNYIWGGLMLVSLATALFSGNLKEVTSAAMAGAAEAVSMSFSLLGMMCFWTGIMKIAQDGGFIGLFTRAMRPLIRLLFPRLPKHSKATDAIVMNITANLFGIGNAATPLGLKAMKELSLLNKSAVASNEMCMFVVINTASLQLIPSTVITLRQGAQNPFEIIVPVWLVSIAAITVGVTAAKLLALKE
ncbi:MAG: hypothetical protein M0R40_01230 [Firmicutes bacterium]|nr:hypothetical protein [Bacillota bacterium]